MHEGRSISQLKTSRGGYLPCTGGREPQLRVTHRSKWMGVSSSGVSHLFLPSSLPSVRQSLHECCHSSVPGVSFPVCDDDTLLSPVSPTRRRSPPLRATGGRQTQRKRRRATRLTGSVDSEEEKMSFLASADAFRRHRRYNNPFTAYCLASDPYDRPREIERQRQFMSSCKRLARRFVAGGRHALDKPTRYMLGECVARLYRVVVRDWPEADPMVVSSAEDLIVVFMNLSGVRNPTTALRYMNALLKRCEVVRSFDLKRVPEGWDVITEDGHLMYTFRPPWVNDRRFLPDRVVARKSQGK